MTRRIIPAAEKAQAEVDRLTKQLAKVKAAKAALLEQAMDLDPEIGAVQKRLDYARANPDLAPKPPKEEPNTTT